MWLSWSVPRISRRLVGDLLYLVADTLELVDDLGDHQHEAQVDRGRLPPGDDLAAHLIEIDLHLVDLLLVGPYLIDRLVVVGLQQRDRAIELCLDESTHCQDPAADSLHLGVELLVRVYVHRGIPLWALGQLRRVGNPALSRTAR